VPRCSSRFSREAETDIGSENRDGGGFKHEAGEREAAYRSARAEAERVDSASDWIAFEATASEILGTVSPGREPRLFQGAPLREAWTRLAGGGTARSAFA